MKTGDPDTIRRKPVCHPGRAHHAFGLCRRCYLDGRKHEPREVAPGTVYGPKHRTVLGYQLFVTVRHTQGTRSIVWATCIHPGCQERFHRTREAIACARKQDRPVLCNKHTKLRQLYVREENKKRGKKPYISEWKTEYANVEKS